MTMDSSWGTPVARTPGAGTPADRERARAEDRERRARERLAAAEALTRRRVADRDAQSQGREQARDLRRGAEDERRAERITQREDRPRRRATGALARTGNAPVERDTRHYATTLDVVRIRDLARRGATVDALAKAFGVPSETVAGVLADD